jgi:hypothetical protein
MISIIVDEGYAYDYLAILAVKGNKPYHDTTYEHIESQIGRELHKKITESREFHDLYDANVQTFNAVELARYWEISAKEVDSCNMTRYNCKVALQNKFFPDKKVVETKT